MLQRKETGRRRRLPRMMVASEADKVFGRLERGDALRAGCELRLRHALKGREREREISSLPARVP